MEVNKGVLVKVFSEQCEELYQDLLKIYPNNIDIKTGLTMVQTMKRFNPKLMIKKYKTSVNDNYYDKIMKGNFEYFIEKDYLDDCHNVGYTTEDANVQNGWIDSLKKLYKDQDQKNKKKLKKYFQQLSKICRMYYS
jgi:hypothetical protein